jgi:hypothetical protein
MFVLGLALTLYHWRRRSMQHITRGQDVAPQVS